MPSADILHSEDEVRARVAEVAARISADYAGRKLEIVYAINGASTFCADLMRLLTVEARVHPLGFASYNPPAKSGEVRLLLDVAEPLAGRDVIFVEGIIVSGRTPAYLMNVLRQREPASLKLCALGIKPKARAVDLDVAYRAFEFADETVVGYGVGEGAEKTLPYLGARG